MDMKRRIRNALIIIVSVAVVTAVFRFTEAGSLTPPGIAVVPSLNTLSEIFAPLVSTSYDSSGVTADKNGNALQITKCIIQKVTGGTPCP